MKFIKSKPKIKEPKIVREEKLSSLSEGLIKRLSEKYMPIGFYNKGDMGNRKHKEGRLKL